jgi:hypothetical protein
MAAAGDAITALTDLGTLLVQTMSGKHVDWSTFLSSADYTTISGQVQQFMQLLTPDKLGDALQQITDTQTKLLNNRSVDQLSRPELDQYLALGNTALQVAAAKDTAGKLELFGHWLTTDGLPLLLKLAPIIIPLLV